MTVSQSYLSRQLASLESQFDQKAKDLVNQLTYGGGLENIHLLGTIRDLEFLYLMIASHRAAVREVSI